MDEGQAVYEDGDVVAGCVCSGGFFVLVDDLEAVVVDVFFVDEEDVFGGAVVSAEGLDVVGLDFAGFFYDSVVGCGDCAGEELFPFGVGEGVVVEGLELEAEVFGEFLFVFDREVFISLGGELLDELFFQVCFALVGGGAMGVFGGVFGDDGGFGGFCNGGVACH